MMKMAGVTGVSEKTPMKDFSASQNPHDPHINRKLK